MIRAVIFAGITLALTSCVTPPPAPQSQLEIQAYQSRDFETNKRVAFDATMSVLQDAGFIIESADFDTGFITGKGPSKSRNEFFVGTVTEHTRMTAFVEQRTSTAARVRFNLVETQHRQSAWNENQEVVEENAVRDPTAYQKLFEQIDQAVFIKENL